MRHLLLYLLITSGYQSQSQNFEKTYGGEEFDRGMHILSTGNGWIVCGYTLSFGNGYQIYLIKLDSLGNKQWERNYGGAGFEMGWMVKKAANDALMVLGMSNSRDSLNHDILVLKIDNDGNMIWEKTYGNNNYERATDLMPTSDGNFLIIGQRNFSSSNIDNYVLKIDEDGNLLWEKPFGDSLSQRSFYSASTSSGDYLIAGTTFPAGSTNTDIVLTKMDKNGNLLWSKHYGRLNDHDIVHSLTANRDGSFTLIGYRSSDRPGHHNGLFMKVDENGNVLAEKICSNNEDLRLMHAEQTKDAGFIATGFTRNDISKDIWDAVLIKFNAQGEKEWIKTFGTVDKDDQGYWIVVNPDGGYNLTGYTHSKGKNGELWIIRTDPKGTINSRDQGK